MPTSEVRVNGGGFGLPTILFVVFLTLKLTGAITWSWWWVTAPLWIPMVVAVVILLSIFIGYMLFGGRR